MHALLALLLVLAAAGPAFAVDGLQLEYGDGDDGIERYGAALQWQWSRKWFADGQWYLGGYWEVSGSYWDGGAGHTGSDSLGEFGFTPVLRLQTHSPAGAVSPFLEAGIGGHVLTGTKLENKDFSTEWQFGSHIGAGLRFGARGRFELLYRFQHLSNAGLGDSNPGVNFHVLRLGWHF